MINLKRGSGRKGARGMGELDLTQPTVISLIECGDSSGLLAANLDEGRSRGL